MLNRAQTAAPNGPNRWPPQPVVATLVTVTTSVFAPSRTGRIRSSTRAVLSEAQHVSADCLGPNLGFGQASSKAKRSAAAKSVRLGIQVSVAILDQVREAARCRNTTIRQYVLTALALSGIRVPRSALDGPAHYNRAAASRGQLNIIVPLSVMAHIVRVQRRRGCARRVVILTAMQAAGIDVPPEEMVPDRRRGPNRTPRQHYAASSIRPKC